MWRRGKGREKREGTGELTEGGRVDRRGEKERRRKRKGATARREKGKGGKRGRSDEEMAGREM
jgi:hypothetical protein